jgi:hypothetical protein
MPWDYPCEYLVSTPLSTLWVPSEYSLLQFPSPRPLSTPVCALRVAESTSEHPVEALARTGGTGPDGRHWPGRAALARTGGTGPDSVVREGTHGAPSRSQPGLPRCLHRRSPTGGVLGVLAGARAVLGVLTGTRAVLAVNNVGRCSAGLGYEQGRRGSR